MAFPGFNKLTTLAEFKEQEAFKKRKQTLAEEEFAEQIERAEERGKARAERPFKVKKALRATPGVVARGAGRFGRSLFEASKGFVQRRSQAPSRSVRGNGQSRPQVRRADPMDFLLGPAPKQSKGNGNDLSAGLDYFGYTKPSGKKSKRPESLFDL